MNEPGIRQHLIAQQGFHDVAGDRCFAERMPQQHPTAARGLPAAVFQRVGTLRLVTQCGTLKLLQATYQVDSYAETWDAKLTLADAIRTAMVDYSGPMGPVRVDDVKLATEFDVGPELEPGVYRRSQTFNIWFWEN